MRDNKECLYCSEKVEGRLDKLFCNPSCKSAHHYQKSLEKEANMYNRIDTQLKTNRRLLKNFNKAGKATVRKEKLLEAGFDPKYFLISLDKAVKLLSTIYWRTSGRLRPQAAHC